MEGISGSTELNGTEFLQLFVKQMQYQNPLEPMENSEFLAQLAQFSSLEQLGTQTDLLSEQLNSSTLTQALQELEIASSLIGKEINYTDSNGNKKAGVVKGVELKDDGVYFKLDDGIIPVAALDGIK